MNEYTASNQASAFGGAQEPACLIERNTPGFFLRFESWRARMALPYAGLLKLEISENNTDLDLTFVTHQVRVHGKNLQRIYKAVSQAAAVQIATIPERGSWIGTGAREDTPVVTEIRIVEREELDRRQR